METEYNALMRPGTWTLVLCPSNANVVGYKWVYRIKRQTDGSIERYKARLVSKGFHQEKGVDYFDNFSPVVKPTTIRIVLSISLLQGWTMHQLDINNTFLNGDIQETVFMTQLSGFIDSNKPSHICHLHKALYGLKQTPQAWFFQLRDFLLSHGFHDCKSSTLYLFMRVLLHLLIFWFILMILLLSVVMRLSFSSSFIYLIPSSHSKIWARCLTFLALKSTPVLIWPPGSLEERVQNLVKTMEMELFHKANPQDYKAIDATKFTFGVNGRKPLTLEEVGKIGGGYNGFLQTSLPEEMRLYDPAKETRESSHTLFTTTFPRGFAFEVLQVYSGPPVIAYKFRHWAYMEGPFKGHPPTGELVEFFGVAIFEVDEQMRVVKVEFFYDRGELLAALMKGAKVDGSSSSDDMMVGCPVLRNTG